MSATKQTSTVVINTARLDAKSPIPLETEGKGYYFFNGNNRYIPFLDRKDNFFQVLIEANLLSPTNNSCVSSKTKFSIGEGWMLADGVEDKKIDEWAKVVNKKRQSFNDIIGGAFNNKYCSGNAFIEIVRTKVGTSRYIKLFLKNFNDCRVAEPDADDDIPTHIIVSKKFRKKGMWSITEQEDVIAVPIYTGEHGQTWYKDSKGNEHAIIHLKNDVPGYDYYGMPSNVACLPQQILEYKMARFNLDNFDNNLAIGGLIVLQGNLTPEESGKVAREITTAHSGDGKRGKYVILSSEAGVENSKVIPFDQTKDYDYINGSKRIEEQIIFANEWSKVLIDPMAGGMGNSGKQIKEIYETKMNTVIFPEQNKMIETLINPIMQACDEWMGTKWSNYKFTFNNITALGIASDVDVNSVLNVDEGREALGYKEIGGEAGKSIIKSNKQLQINVPN